MAYYEYLQHDPQSMDDVEYLSEEEMLVAKFHRAGIFLPEEVEQERRANAGNMPSRWMKPEPEWAGDVEARRLFALLKERQVESSAAEAKVRFAEGRWK